MIWRIVEASSSRPIRWAAPPVQSTGCRRRTGSEKCGTPDRRAGGGDGRRLGLRPAGPRRPADRRCRPQGGSRTGAMSSASAASPKRPGCCGPACPPARRAGRAPGCRWPPRWPALGHDPRRRCPPAAPSLTAIDSPPWWRSATPCAMPATPRATTPNPPRSCNRYVPRRNPARTLAALSRYTRRQQEWTTATG